MPLIEQWMSEVLANLQGTDRNGTERAMQLYRWGCESRRVCVETRVTNKKFTPRLSRSWLEEGEDLQSVLV
jgi:hypothetical protein